MRMWAPIAHLTAMMTAPMTDATMTTASTTVVTIVIVAVIEQKDPSLAKITAAGQTTSSPLSINLAPSATMMSSTKRSSMARALFHKNAKHKMKNFLGLAEEF